MVEHDVIGDVDESGDRPLSGRLQSALHPLRRGPVLHAFDRAAEESRAAFGILDPDRYRGGEAALDLGHGKRLQRAGAGSSEVARDAPHAHRVLPVRRDVHVKNGIVETRISGEGGADGRIPRQLDDPAMIVA
jgi:hypothetical protein